MKKNLFLVVVFLMAAGFASFAQNRKAVKINEVMIINETNVVDDYGEHVPWIELFNSNFGPVDISSIYLSNDPNNPTMYPVPLGDVRTKIAKRQHVIFWADGQATRGTFHTNFTFDPDSANWIGIFDADKKLIDSITVPAGALIADQSYAREIADNGEIAWRVRTGVGNDDADYVTPGAANFIKDENPKINMFAEQDGNGFGMTIMAMCIVFGALLVLCLCFYAIGSISKNIHRAKKARATGVEITEIPAVSTTRARKSPPSLWLCRSISTTTTTSRLYSPSKK